MYATQSFAAATNSLTLLCRVPDIGPASVVPKWGRRMPSRFIRDLDKPDGAYQAEQKREFDRWRNAAEIVKRLREAGISCHLKIDDDHH